jgi:hypothetical protein
LEAAEPEVDSVVAEPEVVSVAVEPEAVSAAAEPEVDSVVAEPEVVSVAVEPEAVSVAAEPVAVAVAAEPEAVSVVAEPEAVSVAAEPVAVAAAAEPEAVSVVAEPEVVSAAAEPVAVAVAVAVAVVVAVVAEPEAVSVSEPQVYADIAVAFVVLVPVSAVVVEVYSSGRPKFRAFPNADHFASSSSSVEVVDEESVHSPTGARTNYGLCSILSNLGLYQNKNLEHCYNNPSLGYNNASDTNGLPIDATTNHYRRICPRLHQGLRRHTSRAARSTPAVRQTESAAGGWLLWSSQVPLVPYPEPMPLY